MDFLRRHAFFLVCGVVALAGIALIVTGARAMPRVLEELNKAEGIHRTLGNLGSRPVNMVNINAARQRIELVLDDRDKVFAKAKELYGYEPLVPGALPDGDALKRNDFKSKYAAEMEKLLASLKYGVPASSGEVAVFRDIIEDEQAAAVRAQREADSGLAPSALPPSGPSHTPAGVLTKVGAREDAAARAHIGAAQKIPCYARHFDDERPPNQVASLDFWPTMRDTGIVDAPAAEDVWYAQIGYWIQKDVVDAIVALNEAAAQEPQMGKEKAWVSSTPVKDVIAIRLSDGYVPREGEEIFGNEPGGYGAAFPPGTPQTVFTGSGSNDRYEVVHFSVKLVMDQRDIPLLIDRLCKNSFHTLLRVSYVVVPPNRDMVGKIYGAEPVVNVLMDFETIMLGEVFRPLMPASVCEEYEINCPPREEFEQED